MLSQIKAANDLIRKLANITKEDSLLEYEISEEGQLLTSLYSKIKEKKVRPVTPLSQGSLFTEDDKHRLRIITTTYMGATDYKGLLLSEGNIRKAQS